MNSYKFLTQIAHKAMLEKGLAPEFSSEALQQLAGINQPESFQKGMMRDLRHHLWCSIDNDDSKDLDQLTFAERLPSGEYLLYIAVANVDGLVHKTTPIDIHAQVNTTSVYTPSKIFPMLPEKLSTNLTSLNEDQERAAIIFEIRMNDTMEVSGSEIYFAFVKNYAQLAYSEVGPWLEGRKAIPMKVSPIPGLSTTLLLQDELAQALKVTRQMLGALTFETKELKAVFEGDKVKTLKAVERNRAHELIENFMIAANTASARYAVSKRIPSFRRVVRIPERWERIVDIARTFGETLPSTPDSKALDNFLTARKKAEPETFPDLSLTIIKLLGSGEYIIEAPGDDPVGHFGLALRDYTHSTAPNRRYPDIITQRLIKASLKNEKTPYTLSQLEALAEHCTRCEDAATKVERHVKKSAAAMVLADRIGEEFKAVVTGASDKGTWVRLTNPPIDGKLIKGIQGVDVGDRIIVRLMRVDIVQGYIDFARVD
ncbi:MAG: RNB domain-containing ribonuclease [Parachlamydiaceae bacterium]|nr:RNB domain-containing ribonuclease [Parachlamydiaceae bacterium]